jgi:uncharacterized protein YjiS (DUF1127 family)
MTTAHTMNSSIATLAGSAANRGAADGLFGRLRTWIAEHARYVRTREELATLTDRELDDIGLVRADIEDISRRAARIAA